MKIVVILSIAVLLIASCDNPKGSSTPDTADFFPARIGSYWLYECYPIDIYGNIVTSAMRLDSVVLTNEFMENNNKILEFTVFNNNVPVDTHYYFKTDNSVFRLYDNEISNISHLSGRWFKIGDFKSSEWHVYDTTLFNYALQHKDTIYESKADYTVNAYYEGDIIKETLRGNRVVKIYRHKFDSRFSFTMNDLFPPVQLSKINSTAKHYWFAENIGIVRESLGESNSYWVSDPQTPEHHDIKQYHEGYLRALVNYSIRD